MQISLIWCINILLNKKFKI